MVISFTKIVTLKYLNKLQVLQNNLIHFAYDLAQDDNNILKLPANQIQQSKSY